MFTINALKGYYSNVRCKTLSSQSSAVSFPSCIWSIQSLRELHIAGNGLRGDLQVFDLTNLTTLNINSNSFTGTLSKSIQYNTYEVFDIASNRITGYLDFNDDVNHNNVKRKLHAGINRFSGPVNAAVIDKYTSIEVLTGNSISCNTLPSGDVSYTDNLFFSLCETRRIYFSIIIWCITLSFCLVIGAINYKRVKDALLWVQDYSLCSESVEIFPRAILQVGSIQKLHKLVLMASLFMITSLVVIYSGFEFTSNANTDYKVQFEKYNYDFSGIYLKSVSPAIVLFIVFTLLIAMSIYTVYRIFLCDWTVMKNATIYIRQDADSSTMNIIVRYFLLFLFLIISLSMNVAYVYGLSHTDSVILLQLGFVSCNSLYEYYGSKLLLVYLSKITNIKKIESALFHVVIMTFSGIINPCLATLVVDDNCFHDYVFPRAAIDASYSVSFCIFKDPLTQVCESTDEFQVPSSLTPPFIYGHHCRDAVFGNYIPIIFLSCAFTTFIYPFLYMLWSNRVQNLNTLTSIFSFSFDSRRLVFEDTVLYFIEGIVFDIVLIILFGVAYPLCFVSLLMNVSSRVYLLVWRYHLYISLYKKTVNDNPELDKQNKEYLESMVNDAALVAPYLIWPGLGTASVIFGLYIFDMAWDTNDNNLGAPIALLFLTLASFVAICFVFFKAKAKLEADLTARVESSRDDHDASTNSAQNQTVVRATLDGVELLSTAENPIRIEVVPR
jgi:hypothetical protein